MHIIETQLRLRPLPLADLAMLSSLLLLAAAGVVLVAAFPDGAPTAACVSLRPNSQVGSVGLEGHTALPQNVFSTYGNPREAPFYIQVFPEEEAWTPGQTYSVSVVANQTVRRNWFTGIMMQVRSVDCYFNTTVRVFEAPVGTFSVHGDDDGDDDDETLLKTMDCSLVEQSTVSHKSPQYKINETAWWTAPDDTAAGDLVVTATLVREANIYWTEVNSKILRRHADVEPRKCDACGLQHNVLLYVAAAGVWIHRLIGHT